MDSQARLVGWWEGGPGRPAGAWAPWQTPPPHSACCHAATGGLPPLLPATPSPLSLTHTTNKPKHPQHAPSPPTRPQLLPRYWAESPGERESVPEEMADRILVFQRGTEVVSGVVPARVPGCATTVRACVCGLVVVVASGMRPNL